jgi:hypothetical protein
MLPIGSVGIVIIAARAGDHHDFHIPCGIK